MKNLALPALAVLLLAVPGCTVPRRAPLSAAAVGENFNFQVPKQCERVTGADGAEAGEPPVVTITYKGMEVPESVAPPTYDSSSKIWSATVRFPEIPDTATPFLVTTTYTPFLQSYVAVFYRPGPNGEQNLKLEPPSFNNQQILATAQISVTDQQSGAKLPGAYLEMAPDFGGSSPYTMQADGNGLVTIYCFTSYVGGNPATILDQNHNLLYDTIINVTPQVADR